MTTNLDMMGVDGYFNPNMGVTSGNLATVGQESSMRQARNQGYKGNFYTPQEYADSYGQNIGKAMTTLQSGFGGQSDDSKSLQSSLFKEAQNRMGGLANNSAQRKAVMSQDLEQGFANQLAQLRRGAAGTGGGASLGYGRSVGNIANQNAQNMSRGLLDVENQGYQQLGQIGNLNTQLAAQEANNRTMDLNQSRLLSELYTRLAGNEGRREEQSAAIQREDSQARQAAQAALIGAITTGAGAALGGPQGAMAGSQVGGIAGAGSQPKRGGTFEQDDWMTRLGYGMQGFGGQY